MFQNRMGILSANQLPHMKFHLSMPIFSPFQVYASNFHNQSMLYLFLLQPPQLFQGQECNLPLVPHLQHFCIKL